MSQIKIEDGLQLRSTVRSNPLGPFRPVILSTRFPGGEIQIGKDVGITGGTICADIAVIIGNRVSIGANTLIMDTDFHPVDINKRREHGNIGDAKPVHIEDDVFIGAHSMILKGVHIESGAVIGAGSVVTKSVPAGTIVAGNPARVIKQTAFNDNGLYRQVLD
ncbi:hypothetical protein KC887_03205 [Candidatus Kaiserbacteria bacterium]|nr:hypothetical protein [Candidatus Kaiserbacteria bacterium]